MFVMKPVDVRLWQPTLTLSNTDMVSNNATFWNVRPMPSLAMAWRGCDRMERPSNSTSPLVGTYRRDRQLKSVVLPAPFGPISPTMCPGATSNDTPSSAMMLPKRTAIFRTLSSAPPTTRVASCGSIEGRVLPKLSCTAVMNTACPIVGLTKLGGIMSSRTLVV